MARLVISFYLMLFISFSVFVIGFTASLSVAMPEPFSTGVNNQIAKGTLLLLSDEFKTLDSQQTNERLTQYREVFGEDLNLINLSELNHFSKEQYALLEKGGAVFELIENPIFINKKDKPDVGDDSYAFYYLKQVNSSKVWRVHFDVDFGGISLGIDIDDEDDMPENSSSKFFTGMAFTIQSALLKVKQTQWQNKIEQLESRLGLPVTLVEAATVNLQPYKKHALSGKTKQKVYITTNKKGKPSIIQSIPHSTLALKIGPIEVSWFMRHTGEIMLFTVFLGLLTSFFIWLWPLWSSLIKIKKAATEFGKGNYSARIAIGKFSPIKTISNTFNAMAEKTQDSIRSQKELTSAVSHELRTPIARMKFSLETLEYSQDKKEKGASIIDIKEDIAELNSLVDELLLYARYDQKNATLNLSNVNLANWFNTSLERLEPLAVNKTLHYQLEGINDEETSKIDARLMTRVIDNLVQNALRYAKQKVSISLRKTQKGYLLLVEDDGEGIPEDQRKKIFEAFSRIDNSRNRRTGGYGLGLAIVEKIVTAHNAHINIQTSTLGGALFEVFFPNV